MTPKRGVRFLDGPTPLSESSQRWAVPSFSPARSSPKEHVLRSLVQAPTREFMQPQSQHSSKSNPRGVIGEYANRCDENDRFWNTSATQLSTGGAMWSPISAVSEVSNTASPLPRTNGPIDKEQCVKASIDPPNSPSDSLKTIDMLNFRYIGKCDAPTDLGRIIRRLAPRASESPRLLQAARDRLCALQGVNLTVPPPPPPPPSCAVAKKKQLAKIPQEVKHEPDEARKADSAETSPGQHIFGESAASISRITHGNTTLDSIDPSNKSSLNFSYSPSSLRGLQLLETSGSTNLNKSGSPAAPQLEIQGNNRLKTIFETSSSKETPSTSSTFREQRLSEEVERLSKDTAELEDSRAKERDVFLRKLRDLQQANQEQENLVKKLEGKVQLVDNEKQDMVKDIERVQRERNSARLMLDQERTKLQQYDQKLRDVENSLNGTISQLKASLQAEINRSRLVIGAETNIRRQREEELHAQTQRNKELNQLLRRTREHLERVKHNHSNFRMELLRAVGMNVNELQDVSQAQFVAEVAKRVNEMKAKSDSMAQALRKVETAPRALVEERDRLERRVKEVLRANKSLEDDNLSLSKKIEDLSNEVISSRALIDKLLKTTHETQENEWEQKEAQYKAAIRNYQQQIRKQSTAVSLELYRAAIEDSKMSQNQLLQAEQKIAALESQILTISKVRQSSDTAKTPRAKKSNEGNLLMSPTEFLEMGLLANELPAIHKSASTAKQAFAESNVKTDKDSRIAAQNQDSRDKGHCPPSRLENERLLHRQDSAEKTRSKAGESPPQRNTMVRFGQAEYGVPVVNSGARERDNLTGMTISFHRSSTEWLDFNSTPSMHSKQKRESISPLGEPPISDFADRYTEGHLTPTQKYSTTMEADLSSSIDPDTPLDIWKQPPPDKRTPDRLNSTTPYTQVHFDKENCTPKVSPKSASKRLRMQKARELGGRKGLKDHLKKIRSPPSSSKKTKTKNMPLRIIHVN